MTAKPSLIYLLDSASKTRIRRALRLVMSVVMLMGMTTHPTLGKNGPELKVESLRCWKNGDDPPVRVHYAGEVRNQGQRQLADIRVLIMLRTSEKALLNVDNIARLHVSPLLPGQTSTFSRLTDYVNPMVSLCEVGFQGWSTRTKIEDDRQGQLVPISPKP